MTIRVGIIAEDQSDVDVLRELFSRYGATKLGIEKFVGKGCGKIKGKCRAWATDLQARGCSRLIVLHDADTRRAVDIVNEIRGALGVSPIQKHVIVVPVRELEAWLLADHAAIRKGLNLQKPIKQIANPEAIQRPKEYLRDVIYSASKKKISYVNTVHNKRIASACTPTNLRRCESYLPLDIFIQRHIVG